MVDILPYVWYNEGMEKMSDLPQKNSLGYFTKDFLPGHYEGVGENLGKFFAGHYEGAKKNLGNFLKGKK